MKKKKKTKRKITDIEIIAETKNSYIQIFFVAPLKNNTYLELQKN